ncbi:MAG TPA: hypothetical protein RMH80_13045, partial [Polyangiaceae bacterium LLY-WYZ-15_(1-7)]|nr:hypothetical protein [Polyangiaceae bacterium LLY-WYZ-15_(1-7)]
MAGEGSASLRSVAVLRSIDQCGRASPLGGLPGSNPARGWLSLGFSGNGTFVAVSARWRSLLRSGRRCAPPCAAYQRLAVAGESSASLRSVAVLGSIGHR